MPRGRQYIDETGHRFGRLVVLRYSDDQDGFGTKWDCKCDCGNTVTIRGIQLRSGNNRSCGCLREMCFEERVALGFWPKGAKT